MTSNPTPERHEDGAAPPPGPPGHDLAVRAADVFRRPRRAMDAVAQLPRWSVPFVVIFLLVAVHVAAHLHRLGPVMVENSRELVLPGNEAAFEQHVVQFAQPGLALRISNGLQYGLLVTLFCLLIPAVVLFCFSRLSEGTGSFQGTLGVVYWAALIPVGVKVVLGGVVLALTGDVALHHLSLQSLLADRHLLDPLLVSALLLGDPVFWWMLVVVALGLARVHRITEKRALVVVIATHVLISVQLIGMVALVSWRLGQVMG